MKAVATRVLMSVALGVLLTVATAWLLAIFGRFTGEDLHANYDAPHQALPIAPPSGWQVMTWQELHGPGVRWDMFSECEWIGSSLVMRMDGGPQRTVSHVRVGFPFPCLTWVDFAKDLDIANQGGLVGLWWKGVDLGLTSGPGGFGRTMVEARLPIRPLWAGFAGNTMVYGTATFGVWMLVRQVRHRCRRKRGLCIACAYAVGDLAQCPECGLARE